MIGSEKQILCEPDGSIAIINHLPATTIFGEKLTLDDMMAILTAHEVTNHIDTMALEIAVEKAVSSGEPIENVIAAKARVNTEIIFQDSERLDIPGFLSEIDSARKAFDFIISGEPYSDAEFAVRYVKEGMVVCQIVEADEEDIYGRKTRKRHIPIDLKRGEGVTEYKALGIKRYTADRSGYVIVDDKMRLNVISPFIISEDNMRLSFVVLPFKKSEDLKVLMKDLTIEYPELVIGNQATMDLYSVIERVQLLSDAGDMAEMMVLANGKHPVDGKEAVVNILVGSERETHDGEAELADHMKMAQYCMVDKDEVLVEVIKEIDGDYGMDVHGNELAPPDLKNRAYDVGQNIRKEESMEKILLIADKAGCFISNNNHFSVTDTLMIDGDVGPRTGNICQGSSVIISGNVLAGFTVECKDELIVKGSIENGAIIRCGNLIVKKGVFARKGMIHVKGNADIGYIQDAVVRVNGDLTVQKYLHNSNVTVRGNLNVYGRGVKGKDRGAVMGGRVSVLNSAVLHSVGNENEETAVVCGVDQDMYDQIVKGQTVMSSMQTDITMLKNQVGVDLEAPNAIDVLSNLSNANKAMVADKLKQIKALLIDIETYKSKIEQLSEKAFATDINKVSIAISSHLIPKTNLAIGTKVMQVSSKMGGGTAKLIKGDIAYK